MNDTEKQRLNRITEIIYTIYDNSEGYVAIMGLLALALIMLLTTGNAVARYVIDDPINGTYEIIELYLMPMVIFLYAARLQKAGGNINVDILYGKFPEATQMFIDLLGRVLALVIFAAISYIAGVKFWEGLIAGRMSVGVIAFPIYLSWLIMAIGLLTLVVRLLYQIRKNIIDLYRLILNGGHSEVTE